MQPNLHFFAVSFAPEIAADKKLKPQKSYHRSVSIEQKISEYTFRVEGFYNNFWDVMERDQYTDSSGTVYNVFANRGKAKTKGIEVMAKISDEHEQGLFGWISYTYNTSKYRRDVNDPTDNDSHKWLDSYWEMLHVAKVVTGYTMGRHTLSAKFQYNSSLPYTPIVGSEEDTDFMAATGKPRNVPVYGETNSKRDKAQYELDLRYTYTTKYSWGHIAWFIDIMNATNYRTREYTWDYRYAYSSKNPKFKKTNSIAFLPTFGVEAKF
jgi:outer membrane receptor protein involved in Fe transport